MAKLLELAATAVSGDATPDERKAAQQLFARFGWRVVVVLALLWGFGLGEPMRLGSGFAFADDVDKKIKGEVESMRTQMSDQSKVLERVVKSVDMQIANSVASDLRLMWGKLCAEKNSNERDRLWGEIEKRQDEYFDIKGRRYTLPDCKNQ